MKKINIKDVAKALNVSISTVSRAFNDRYDINPETKRMILEKSAELGYTPNLVAKQMTMRKSFTIGVVVPEFINSFFPEIIMGIQAIMNKAGYQVLIMSSQESAKIEEENIKSLVKNNVDGIIMSLSQETRDITFLNEILKEGTPIIQFNRISQKLSTPKIIFEDYKWACEATEHLIHNGYKKIYHLAGPINMIVSHNRVKGFTDTMKKYKLPFEQQRHIIETGIFLEDGRKAAQKLIESYDVPEALFCFNDPLAIGAMEVFMENGYHIPYDIAFVGFTESQLAKHTVPKLTSIKQPTKEIGEEAAKLLLEIINGKKMHEKIIFLDGKMNIRASSAKKQTNNARYGYDKL